jgi:hypothetical protein
MMDWQAMSATVYPLGWDNYILVNPPLACDLNLASASFDEALMSRLAKAGLSVIPGTSGVADAALAIRPRVAAITQGNAEPFMNLVNGIRRTGMSVLEIEGTIELGGVVIGQFSRRLIRGATFGQRDLGLIFSKIAQKLAGQVAKDILAALDIATPRPSPADPGLMAGRSALGWQAWVRARLLDGVPFDFVANELTGAGLTAEQVRDLAAATGTQMRHEGVSNLIQGMISAILGLLLAYAAYESIVQTGRNNLLIWMGLMIPLGVAMVYYGLREYQFAPRD